MTFIKFRINAGATLAALLASTAAYAADVVEEVIVETAESRIGYRIGAAFAAVHNTEGGSGVESSGGADASDTRLGGVIDATLGYEFANGIGLQGDVYGAKFEDPDEGDLDDWTDNFVHGAGHVYYRFGNVLVGAFGGYGSHDDTGDSDDSMTYWFGGAEAKMLTGWGSVFGQVGYLDSQDEYDEGTQEAPFVRLGANYFVNDNLALKIDGSYAGGDKYGPDFAYDNRILDLGLEAEYKAEAFPVSAFGRYEFTQVSWEDPDDGEQVGDNFHTFMVGLRFRSGSTLREADGAPGSLDLPSVGKWVAYNANEVE
jgi:opacity protein-like surface antigen